jgi:hypothetical protein
MKQHYIFLVIILTTFQLSIAQTPDWQWVKRGGGTVNLTQGSETTSTGVERVLDLAIDSNNNYYFLTEIAASQTDYDGSMVQTYSVNGNRKDIFMFSTDCQGNFRWSKTIGGGIDDWATSIKIDGNNEVYLSGMTRNNQTQPVQFANDSIKIAPLNDGSLEEARKQIFVIKYDDQGNFQWLREPEGPVDNLSGFMQKTVVEPNGRSHSLIKLPPNTHLEGQLTVTDSSGQSVIVIYDANANLEDFILIDLKPGFDWYDYQFAYDPNLQQYYIADTVRGTEPELSINGFGASTGDDKAFYLAALDNQGQVLWYHENNNVGGWSLGDIAIDDNGDVYFTGYQNNNFSSGSTGADIFAGYTFVTDSNENDNQHPFLIKLDSNGNLIWGTNAVFYSPYPGRDISFFGNDVYLGLGSLNNQWDGQAFGNETPNTGLFSSDGAVLRFNKSNGNLEEVIGMPGTGYDMIMAMDIDSNGNIVVGGHFGGTLLPGHPQSVTKVGGDTDFFIAQYGTGNCTLNTEEFSKALDIKLYPQPARGMVYLQSQNNLTRYEIYSIQGQNIQAGEIHNDSVDISKLANGLYFIKVGNQNGQTKVMKLLVE